jgi:hypothetical protein
MRFIDDQDSERTRSQTRMPFNQPVEANYRRISGAAALSLGQSYKDLNVSEPQTLQKR